MKITLKEFQELSTRTAPHNADPQNHIEKQYLLTNYVLGLNGEIREFDAEISNTISNSEMVLSEAGDVLHYAVILLETLGKKATDESLGFQKVSAKEINSALIDTTEIIKKTYYHGHEFKEAEFVKAVKTVINYLYGQLGQKDFCMALQMNIDKLKERYPEGFSSQASIERVDTLRLNY